MTRGATVVALFCSIATVALLVAIVSRDYPMIGHDHRYYIPRLIDTELHIRQSGYLSVQWYTPTFGGGVPAFPNPQHLQHTALQVLTRVVNPWHAILITTALASFVGFFAFRRFLTERLGVTPNEGTLGAVLFVANGFYIEHLIVGHVGYQLFPLAAVILYALSDRERDVVRCGAVIALVVVSLLFHAGTYVLILIALSCLLVLPLLAILGVGRLDVARVTSIVLTAGALTLFVSAAKLHAVFAFMRQFPREIADVYDASLLQGLAGLGLQLAGAMTVAPAMMLAGIDPARLEGAMGKLAGASVQVGIWELDTSLSPVVWIVLTVAAIAAIRNRGGWARTHLERRHYAAFAMLLLMTWVMVEATLARGLIYPWIKPLPVLRSLHVNHRIASVFLIPLIMITITLVHRWHTSARGRYASGIFVALLGLALASPLAYFLFPARVHQRSFDVSLSIDTYEKARQGETFEVSRVLDVSDAEALALGATSYRPYEPLFGYDLGAFTAQIVPGDVRDIRDGTFNLTNPVSLVFPRENGLMPFDRISAADSDALEAFVRRKPTAWPLPARQSALMGVSVFGFVTTLFLAFAPRRMLSPGAHARSDV